jgi:hypothetical protein
MDSAEDAAGLRIAETRAALETAQSAGYLDRYHRIVSTAWIFAGIPGLLTTIFGAIFVFTSRGRTQLWWLTLAAIWSFSIVLLSTVGRPLVRYLIPVTPVIFWTLSSAFIVAWNWTVRRFLSDHSLGSVSSGEPHAS